MKLIITLLLVFSIGLVPAFAQSQQNPSLVLETIEIPAHYFNTVGRDTIIVDFEKPHIISWQVTIRNDLLYANPNGNAVVRFYDKNTPEKFLEIGMGSPPENKFWIAVLIPDDPGYVVVHSKLERGWKQELTQILAYTERAGLTVNNGERIVLSNLDIGTFQMGSYSVFGKEGSTDPPAVSSGNLQLEILSGDPAKNIIHLYPFFLAGGIGIIVAVLLVTKKRT
ncbi:MAG: hypothetical protein ACE1YV_01680 [Nitrosopumilaceae archaeon]